MTPLPLRLVACSLFCLSSALAGTGSAFYGDPPDAQHPWVVHDRNRPVPPIVQPGEQPGQPPSDAIVLFDGKNLDAWESSNLLGITTAAKWEIVDGAMQVVPKTGTLRTKQKFGDCQLHIEWTSPVAVSGDSQGRGNSGVFLMGRYEVQVLDSHQNESYADGQAASIYAQNPPLVNACRAPGVWQSYDIVFHAPRFNARGEVSMPGSITVFHNGVLVQDGWIFEGLAGHKTRPKLSAHEPSGPLELQDHGNQVRFRNVWIREIPPKHSPGKDEIAAQRKATAASLRAQALEQKDSLERLMLSLESLVYVPDETTLAVAKELAAERIASLQKLDRSGLEARAEELKRLHVAFKYLQQFELLPAGSFPVSSTEALLKKAGIELKP